MATSYLFGFDSVNAKYFKKCWVYSGLLLAAALLLIALILGYFSGNSKMLIRDQYYFSGNAKNGNGYTSVANDYLKIHIEKSGYNEFTPNPFLDADTDIFNKWADSSFVFFIPADGELSGIRLFDIIKFHSPEEKLFYNNSFLEAHLRLQRENPERNVFNLEFEKSDDKKSLRLISVTIDGNLLATPLLSNSIFWKGNITGSCDSMFKNYFFVRLAKAWLPIADRFTDTSEDHQNIWEFPHHQDIDFYAEDHQYGLIEGSLFGGKSIYRLNLGEGRYIKIQKYKNQLEIVGSQAGDLQFFYFDSTKNEPVRKSDTLMIEVTGQNIEIGIKHVLSTAMSTIYCTKTNPFNLVSGIVHHNNRNFRKTADGDYTDNFSTVAGSKIAEIENSFLTRKNAKQDSGRQLTLNPVLSSILENQMTFYVSTDTMLRKWYNGASNKTLKMGIVVSNTATGEIIAAPWIDKKIIGKKINKDLINFNLLNHPIGSCFKPLTLFAAYRHYPQLSSLKLNIGMFENLNGFTPGTPRKRVKILGYPTEGFEKHSDANEDVNRALAKSSNLYTPVAFLYTLTENNATADTQIMNHSFPNNLYRVNSFAPRQPYFKVRDSLLHLQDMTNSKMANNLSAIFNIEKNDLLINNRDIYDYYLWDKRFQPNQGKTTDKRMKNYGSISPERVSLRLDLFSPNPQTPNAGEFRTDAVSWLLGSQNNRWNNVKLAEAFSRLITGRGIMATMYQTTTSDSTDLYTKTKHYSAHDGDKANFQAAHITLLNALNSRVNPLQRNVGTWLEIAKQVDTFQINGITGKLVMLAKTGSAADEDFFDINDVTTRPRKIWKRRGLFMFAVMTEKQYDQLKQYINSGYQARHFPAKLGFTGVITIEMTDNDGKKKTSYSKYAKEFIYGVNLRKLIVLNKHLLD
jgi:hypothetical protein